MNIEVAESDDEGFGIIPSEEQSAREELIFRTLFPDTDPSWIPHAKAKGLPQDDLTTNGAWRWRNRLCDVQAFWAHDEGKRDVFVTSDQNFADRLPQGKEFCRGSNIDATDDSHPSVVIGQWPAPDRHRHATSVRRPSKPAVNLGRATW